MSNLYIKVVDGVPVGHPMLADNLRGVLQTSTLNDLIAADNGYLPFKPVLFPDTKQVVSEDGYEVCEDGAVRPKVTLREMSAEEKRDKFIRPQRDFYLYQSDWTQGGDAPLSAEQRAAWAVYRQALRDVPQNFSDAVHPDDVIWPTKPE